MNMQHAFQPLILLCTLTGLSLSASAQVQGPPAFVDYQGTIYDSTGVPYGSAGTLPNLIPAPENKTMEFRVYNIASGGTAANLIWAETQTVTVSLGQFSVRLGSGAQITAPTTLPHGNLAEAFNGKERFLELTVINPGQTPAPILPRLAFQSSPFSFVAERAVRADSVAGGTFSGAVNATAATFTGGTYTGATFTGGTFSGGAFSGNGAGLSNLNGTSIQNGTINMAALVAAVREALCPPGSVMAFAGPNGPSAAVPEGWLLCDGRALDKDADGGKYLALFNMITTAWGNGSTGTGANGDTDFNLPDLRGMFLRGVNGSLADTDPWRDPDKDTRVARYGGQSGNQVGSAQLNELKSHTHQYVHDLTTSGNDGSNSPYERYGPYWTETTATGGNESRPNNVYVNYIIKL